MQLLDYMRREGIGDGEMAEKIGGCSAAAVKKYKYRERQPGADRMQRIAEITGKEVGLRDWAEPRATVDKPQSEKPHQPTTVATRRQPARPARPAV